MHSPLASNAPRPPSQPCPVRFAHPAAGPARPSSCSRAPHAGRLRLPSIRLPPLAPAYRRPSALAPQASAACACCAPVPGTNAPTTRQAPPARALAAPSVPSCLANLSHSQYKKCIAIHFLLSLSTACHNTIWIVS